jgi:hypothetical protein
MIHKSTATCLQAVGSDTIDIRVERIIARCRKVWEKHETRGLEARHALGKLLNAQLETAAKRQKYGAQVLKRAAKELGIARSELTRMMQFAKQFADVCELQKQHPGANWTLVRQLLAKPSGRVHATARSEKSPMSGVVKTLTRITAKFRRGELPRDGAEAEVFQRNLQELIEVVKSYLQIETQRSVA